MKSPVAPLRKAYKDRLSNIQFRGAGVRVIGKAQNSNPASPYVILSTQTNAQADNKNGYHNLSTILLDVVGIYEQNISEVPVDELADLILQNIIPNGVDVGPDFNLITTKLTSDNTLDESTDTNVVYRRLLRIEHQIEQL